MNKIMAAEGKKNPTTKKSFYEIFVTPSTTT